MKMPFFLIEHAITTTLKQEVIWRFYFECTPLVDFLSTFFKELKYPGVKQIRICLSNNSDDPEVIQRPLFDFPVCKVQMVYDFENDYFSATSSGKISEIIKILKQGSLRAAVEMGWDQQALLDIFSEIETLNYDFLIAVGNPKSLKGSKVKIQIEYSLVPEFRHFYLKIINPESENKFIKFLTLNNYYAAPPENFVSEFKWIDANTFSVIGKKGNYERLKFIVSIESSVVVVSFNLETDINEVEFQKDFNWATTQDDLEITAMLQSGKMNDRHVYL